MTDKIHIVRATISNFMRLKAAEVAFDPEKGLHRITGPNRAGKTSLLSAIHAAFGGAGAVPDQPIHEGATQEEGSFIQVALSNGFSIERRFTPAGTYLSVVGPDGGKHGQTKINEWVGANSFDPMGFFGLRPKEAKEVLLGLSTDPDLPEKLEELDDRRQELYEGRTPYIIARRDAGKVTEPEGERPEPVDVSADSERLEELREAQAEQVRRETALQDAEDNLDEIVAGIATLEERLRKAREMKAEVEKRVTDLTERVMENAGTDYSTEIEAIRKRLGHANETSAKLEEWRRYDEAQRTYEEAVERERELTNLIDEVDSEKDRLLAEAGPPIEGLTFDAESGEPMLNGRPLAQASGAERIRVAVEVALVANPDLKIALVDEANALDLDSMAALDKLARDNDFQILAVRLGIEGDGDIVVADGVATNAGREDG